jgi:hypothetical protein
MQVQVGQVVVKVVKLVQHLIKWLQEFQDKVVPAVDPT